MRISQQNVQKYLKDAYSNTPILQQQRKIDNFTFLLQKDYGEACDCTLTSMTAIVYFLSKNKSSVEAIYSEVEKLAKKRGYKGSRGTPLLTIQKVFTDSLKKYGLSKSSVKYGKDLGFTFNTIKEQIDKGNPIILSMSNDGRHYYGEHSVTILGYEVYKVGARTVRMLAIADNWNKGFSYVNYEKLSKISTLHYWGTKKFNFIKKLKNLI